MDYSSMSKKQFKDYINENGFFVNFTAKRVEANSLEKEEINSAKVMHQLPKGENILVFEGIASQNYGLGEKNRNGYKIDPKGWTFKNYKNNPVMLLQHNHEYGGIGHSVKLFLDNDGNLVNRFYVDINTLDEKTKYQVNNGFINAVSTSHITLEDMIEDNKTGERMTREEAYEKNVDLWGVMFGTNNDFTLVVTKADMIENSMVTIGSNEDAIVSHNSIGNYFTNKYLSNMKLTKEQKNDLLAGKLSDEIKAKINNIEPEDEKVEEKEETTKEEVKEEVKEEENKEEEKVEENKEEVKEEVKTEENNVEGEEKEEKEEKKEEKEEEKEEKEEEATEEDANSSENDDSNNDESENDSQEDSENEAKTVENMSENDVKETVKNEMLAQKETFNNEMKVCNDNFKELENKFTESENKVKELTEGLSVALENLIEVKSALKSIVVNGVSSYEKSDATTDNRLTNLIKGFKK